MCGLVCDASFANITRWKTDFVAKGSIPKATQNNAKNASEASKKMNTGAEGAGKKWVLDDPKKPKFQDFQLLKLRNPLITTPPPCLNEIFADTLLRRGGVVNSNSIWYHRTKFSDTA